MPTYDYKCTKCGDEVVHFHGINEDKNYECNKCKGSMIKQISAVPTHFKGRGWAKDGYK